MLARHRREEEVIEEARLRERAKRFGFSLVAANEVLYHSPARRRLQDVLTAIRHGIPRRFLRPEAQAQCRIRTESALCFCQAF